MHPNPVFRSNDQAIALAAAGERGFGVLTVTGPAGILASHLPFVVEGTTVDCHVPRSNPIGRLLRDGPLDALLIVSGPDAYITTDWYEAEETLPTWNYVAVHIRGTLAIRPQVELTGHLEQLVAINEARLAPKPPWTVDKNDAEATARLMRMLLPLRMTIGSVDSTWKLSQNRPAEQRLAAAAHVEHSDIGQGPADIARLMRGWEDLSDRMGFAPARAADDS